MHAMSHRSDIFLTCSSKVKLEDPALYLTISNLLTVTHGELPRVHYCTAMSDTKYLHTSQLEVMISSKNEHVLIRNLTDLTLQIIFDAWWASIHLGSKRPVACNISRHAPSW